MDEKTNKPDNQSSILFIQLVSMFQIAAMQHMGKIMNPVTNKIERDLVQAKMSIDMIDMIKNKSSGNLTGEESEFLDKTLFELQMNYVDEVNKHKQEEPDPGGGSAEKEGGPVKKPGEEGSNDSAGPSVGTKVHSEGQKKGKKVSKRSRGKSRAAKSRRDGGD